MVIAKTASRNVAFKSGKMMDTLFQGPSRAHTPQSRLDPDLELEGLASDTELYIFNQDERCLRATSRLLFIYNSISISISISIIIGIVARYA